MDASNKTYRMIVNEEIIFTSNVYSGTHLQTDRNVIILNGFSSNGNNYKFPFNGAITDVNIWNRILSEKETSNWSKCVSNESGNTLNWEKAQFKKSEKITIGEMEKYEICEVSKPTSFIAFKNRLQFEESIQFCKNVGGQLSEAKNEYQMKAMKTAVKELSAIGRNDCPKQIFSGYLQKHGKNESAILDDEPIPLFSTSENGLVYDNCLLFDTDTGDLSQGLCHIQLCPICVFNAWPVEFQLRGIKTETLENNLDSHYYLINSSHLIGKTKSQIISTENGWNIIDGNREIYFSQKNITFPIGVKTWFHGKGLNGQRKLNLLNLEKHHKYCCNDGTCISEGQVLFLFHYRMLLGA